MGFSLSANGTYNGAYQACVSPTWAAARTQTMYELPFGWGVGVKEYSTPIACSSGNYKEWTINFEFPEQDWAYNGTSLTVYTIGIAY